MDPMKPRELTSLLMAYTNEGYFNVSEDSGRMNNSMLLAHFENQFRSKHDMMNPEDISKYFYCFTVAGEGFKGDGRFYKYL